MHTSPPGDPGMQARRDAATQSEALDMAGGKRIDFIPDDIRLADGSSGTDQAFDIRENAAKSGTMTFGSAFA
jgi:hypothetical protein